MSIAVPSDAFVITVYTSVSPMRVISCASDPPIADRSTVTKSMLHEHPSMTVTFSWDSEVPSGAIDAGFASVFVTSGASLSTAVRLSVRTPIVIVSFHVAFWSAVAPHTAKVITAPSSDSLPLTGSRTYLPAVSTTTLPLSSPPMYALITVPIEAFASLSVTLPENLFGRAGNSTADTVPDSTRNIERTIDVVINNFVLVLLLLLIPLFVLIFLSLTVSLFIIFPSFHVITYNVSV